MVSNNIPPPTKGCEQLLNIVNGPAPLSRRGFIRNCASTATLTSVPILGGWALNGRLASGKLGPASRSFSLNKNWLFGGRFDESTVGLNFDDSTYAHVTLPHCVTKLSWQKWDPAQWEDIWIYRRHFAMPQQLGDGRVFLHFDRVMAAATLLFNGHALAPHLGGYLPFRQEISGFLKESNTLSVKADSRWMSVPPAGSPKGVDGVDYFLPGGITGSVDLHVVPQVFLSDVFAKPVNVLSSSRQLEISCTVDAASLLQGQFHIQVSLWSGSVRVAGMSKSAAIEKIGENQVVLTLTDLRNILLWDVTAPHLYDVVVTLSHNGEPIHDYRTRVGFREARFDLNGFFLNGRRLQLFGLNRHELYPYVGYAMPSRAMRRDAEILKKEFNCNVVRCSHYPQSPAFLDACDELGLMVWEETPGWGYLGDEHWKDLVIDNVGDMVRRDRNHPSIIIWGVRVNESRNDPALYGRTRGLAKSLDDSRPTSGSMTLNSMKSWKEEWHQDVFALDDYHAAPDGSVALTEPLAGVPFFFSEAVGQFSYDRGHGFESIYRRAGDLNIQKQQAILHAQVHDRGAAYKRCGGVVAWCGFDYGSPHNSYSGVKCPGVADVFRIPKLGASFYRSQVDPTMRPVIEPNFYWDFGPRYPRGPGQQVAIFSNCERLELLIYGSRRAVLHPDAIRFPHLKYPPFFVDLDLDGSERPELRIDGYIGNVRALSRSFSANAAADQLLLKTDDTELLGDGSDMTRLTFEVTDKFGAPRPFVRGEVAFQIQGPGIIVGDNPFQLEESGGSGAIWIKTTVGGSGKIRIQASHSELGNRSVEINVRTVRDDEII